MIILEKGATNSIAVTLAEKSNLASPYYFIVFQPDLVGSASQATLLSDISPFPRRYNKFEIVDTAGATADPMMSQVDLPTGWGTYTAYESDVPTITVTSNTPLLEEGKYWVIEQTLPFYPINDIYR